MSRGARVLVVDDDETNRMMLSYRLELDGIEVITAEDGLIAIEKLNHEPIDLVLLDILMPELDGFGVLHLMKADPKLRDVPVVMISSLGDMGTVIKCLEIGASDYLPKPLDALLLLSRVNNILLHKEMAALEQDHEQQLGYLEAALTAIAAGDHDPAVLATVVERQDAFGRVGRLLREFAGARHA